MAGITVESGHYETKTIIVSMTTFSIAVFGSILFRKFAAVIPVLIAIIVGYSLAIALGIVDFSRMSEAAIFAMPNFTAPIFNFNAIITIIPAVFVVISEHIGHFMLTQHIIGRDIDKDPGLHRSILGNGIFTMVAGFFGSVPNTTYCENSSVMAIRR